MQKEGESCHPHYSLFLVRQHHHCQRDGRLLERHTGKSRSSWTIRGADSSAKWAATLTWILITVVTIRKSLNRNHASFPLLCSKLQQRGHAWWNSSLNTDLHDLLITLSSSRDIEFWNILSKNNRQTKLIWFTSSLADIRNNFLLLFDNIGVWSAEKVSPEILLFILYCICSLPPDQQSLFIWWTLKVSLKTEGKWLRTADTWSVFSDSVVEFSLTIHCTLKRPVSLAQGYINKKQMQFKRKDHRCLYYANVKLFVYSERSSWVRHDLNTACTKESEGLLVKSSSTWYMDDLENSICALFI